MLTTIIWGSAFSAQSAAMDHIGPFTFQAARCALAALALIPIILIADIIRKDGRNFFKKWADPKLWKAGILCGIPLCLACNLQQIGLVDTSAGKSGFITAMYIVFVPLIELFTRKKPSFMVPISVSIAVVGLYFISCAGITSIQASDLITVLCAIMFAVQITFVGIYAKDIDALRLNTVQALICTVLSAIFMAFTEKPTVDGLIITLPELAYVGILSMGIGYFLQIYAQKHLSSTPAALIMSLESVCAAIFGVILLHESMSNEEILGATLIFIAVILSQIPVEKLLRKKKIPTA